MNRQTNKQTNKQTNTNKATGNGKKKAKRRKALIERTSEIVSHHCHSRGHLRGGQIVPRETIGEEVQHGAHKSLMLFLVQCLQGGSHWRGTLVAKP